MARGVAERGKVQNGPTVERYPPTLGSRELQKRRRNETMAKAAIDESQAGMEVTSYLPAEGDRA